jgi:hypothetical protein
MRLRALIATLAIAAPLAGCGSSSPAGPTPVTTLSVSSVSPASGTSAGGTSITITGTNFGSDATVMIGGTAATGVTLSGSTSLAAVTPAHSAGAAAVIVTSGGQSATAATGFTFVAPSGTNQPPVISSIRSVGSRTNQASGFGDIGESVTLIATVTDADTATSALTFAWSVPQGTVTGTGAAVTWVLPASLTVTPSTLTATVTVTEPYTENGVAQRNTTTGTFAMSVHDSQKEILDLGQDFLELFSVSSYAPSYVVRNFSQTCDGGTGYHDELSDVVDNRNYYLELSGWSVAKVPPATFNFGTKCAFRSRKADACARFSVHWYDKLIATDPDDPTRPIGSTGETQGIDYVTAVLENDQWRLCHSDYSANEPPALLTGFARFLFRKHGGGQDPSIPGPPIR